jgi:hypothetical protein
MFLTQKIWLIISTALRGRLAVMNIGSSLEKNYSVKKRLFMWSFVLWG